MATDFTGQTLGRFRVLDLLGRGGMGDVYRARDESLGRDLAIKILPPEVTHDPKRVERFVQEARAASALNHPHLLTVYDIGADPVHYIAMELVHGRTLRSVLEEGRPDTKRALEWIGQVADALGAAHGAGVVHRDIKPENLMIAADGYAKVLDFGVAKLRSGEISAASAATRLSLTEAGDLLGTSGYMSPEQARGLPTDHRTDVFSLGCVLYECITGAAPFEAPSVIERLHRVISDEPALVARSAPEAPAELSGVIRKCLAKDPAERYQSMKDLSIDLRHIRRQLEPGAGSAAASTPPRRRVGAWAAVAALAVLAATLGVWLTRGGRGDVLAPERTPATIQQLTSSGNTIDAVISPDGRDLAHIEAVGATQSMWMRSLETGDDRLLVPARDFAYYGMQFSPDGQSVVFTTRGKGFSAGRLNIVPRGGGEPKVLLSTIMTSVTFSPDGRQMAFLRAEYPDGDSSVLIVANADGTGERVLATRRAPESFAPAFFPSASWSPDGSLIVVAARNIAARRSRLIAFDARTGSEQELYASTQNMTYTLWLPDGAGILFVSRSFDPYTGSPSQVWLKPYPSGVPRRITSDLVDYRSLSITSNGQTLEAVGSQYQAALTMIPLDGSAPLRLPSERHDGLLGVASLPDGSMIATTIVKGETQLVHIARDGKSRTLLTSVGTNTQPAVSPDGSVVAMVSSRDGADGVWRMNVDGSDQRLLAHVPAAAWLSITPDGRRVICTSYRTGQPSIWSVPIDGGQAVEIGRGLERASVSPDGKWLGGFYQPAGNVENSRPAAAVVPLDGSAPIRALGTLIIASGTGILTWNQDGTRLIASTNERFNLWSYGLDGGEPRRLTGFADEILIRGALTLDGRHIVASRGTFHRDPYTITGFK